MRNYRLTSIKETKKGRFALFFEDKFLFSVDEEVLVKYHLEENIVLSEDQIDELKKVTDYNKARERAFQLLSIRQHSEKELYDKLERKYDEHTATEIVQRFRELGLLNDEEFASNYYQQLIQKGKSVNEAKVKLIQKGISRDIIDLILVEDDHSEEDTIRDLVMTKYRGKIARENGKELVFASLARRGFRLSEIRKVLGEVGEYEYEE